ncbi:MAG: hypothetical protein P8R42_28085 [Candidatus Binatia bacterium]|nr:hypothetical protein [Candidatus Binatia bacterium]
MITFRVCLSMLLIATVVSACSGYRRGPNMYGGVRVGSPWYGYPGYGYGYPVYVGDGGNPDIDLPPENLPSPPPEAVTLPSMGMPDAGGYGGGYGGGFDGGGFDGGGFDGGF